LGKRREEEGKEEEQEEEQKQEFSLEEIKESTERIEKEKGFLDIHFDIDSKGWVRFHYTKEQIDQIAELLKDKNCKVIKIDFEGKDLGPEGATLIADALKDKNCKVTKIKLFNLEDSDSCFEEKVILEKLRKELKEQGRKMEIE